MKARSLLILSLLGSTSLTGLAVAQDAAAQDAGEPVDLGTLYFEGGKREQEVLTYPGTVSVASQDDIEARSVRNLHDLERVFSGVVFDNRGSRSYANVSVRGQPSLDFYSPTVQLYIDDVPQEPAMLGQALPLGVDSAELLYGPQGTLYGRGAVGGVINITTPKPGEGPSVALNADAAANSKSLSGRGQVQLAEGLWADATLNRRSEGDDLTLSSGGTAGGTEIESGQVRLRYASGDIPLDVMVSASRIDVASDEEYYVTANNFKSREASAATSFYEQSTSTLALTANYDLGWGQLTSVTSYQDRDLDRTVYSSRSVEAPQTTNQEFRLSSDTGDTVNYVLGVNFQRERFNRDASVTGFESVVDIEAKNLAVFGDLTWSLTDKLDVSPGVRIDYESAETTSSPTNPEEPQTGSGKESWNGVSPKIGASYAINDATNVFGLVSTGFKAGGFTRSAPPTVVANSYDPQRTRNAEIGLKHLSKDGRWSGSISAYYTQTQDFQMFVGEMPSQYLQNVGDTKARGVDASVRFQNAGWSATAGTGLNKTEFTSYSNPLSPNVDLTGNDAPYAPKLTATVTVDYTYPLSGNRGFLVPRIGLFHQGGVFFDEANAISQDAYTLVDAGVAWQLNNGGVVDFYATNLTNEAYSEYGFSYGSTFYKLGRGREFGVNLRRSF